VRDLSCHMSNPSEEHWQSVERCVGHLMHLSDDLKVLCHRRPLHLQSISCADADCAECEDSRKSISGGISTVGGTLTNWWSKKQTTVALSSTELEIHSCSLCAQEAPFTNTLLTELFGETPEAAVAFEDNQRCIFLIQNQSVSQKTKHVQVRVLFGREQFDKKTVAPFFCRTDVQHSDGAAKNLPLNTFERHNWIIWNGPLLEGVDMEDVQSKLAKGNSGMKRPS